MATRSTNTMAEFLQRMLSDLATAKTLPDADLEFLIGLETTILQKLREPIDAIMGQRGASGGQVPAMPQPDQQMGMGMLGGSGMTPPSQERVTGTRMMPPTISPDEFQRMMPAG